MIRVPPPSALCSETLVPREPWLRPFSSLTWVFFRIWTAIGAVVMPLRLDPERLTAALGPHTPPWCAGAAGAILRAGDAVWIVLAAVLVFLDTATAEGLSRARRWALVILPGAAISEWVGARTGLPFGPYAYTTDRFGWRLGGVLPFTIPLAWLVIVLGARALVLRLWPQAGRGGLAFGTAVVGVLTDVNLEFIAWRERNYWEWYPGAPAPLPSWPPWQNFAAWMALLFLFSLTLPPDRAVRTAQMREAAWRPAVVLLAMNGLFLLLHSVRFMRAE